MAAIKNVPMSKKKKKRNKLTTGSIEKTPKVFGEEKILFSLFIPFYNTPEMVNHRKRVH